MKRRLRLVVATAVVATAGAFFPPSSASADTDACAGTGTATLSTGFGLPGFTVNTAAFSFSWTAGACVAKTTFGTFATGTVTGACGLSTGAGIVVNGHSFSFVSQGTVMVLTGQLTGVALVTSDPTAGSCTNKTATRFFVSPAAVLQHCTLVQSLTTVFLPWGPGTVHVCVGL